MDTTFFTHAKKTPSLLYNQKTQYLAMRSFCGRVKANRFNSISRAVNGSARAFQVYRYGSYLVVPRVKKHVMVGRRTRCAGATIAP